MPKDTSENEKKQTKKAVKSKNKSNSVKDLNKENTTKKSTKKTKTSTTKKSTTKTSSKSKKEDISNKLNTKKTTSTKLKKKDTKDTKTSKSKKFQIIEYYDLPYSYNQTTVKILYQTPTTLFVYWDISEEDRKNYIEKYGDEFFYNSKPVLIIHNLTKQTNFEVEIDDFANSWYLKMTEPNCKYEIELGRRITNVDQKFDSNKEDNKKAKTVYYNQYILVANSNDIYMPNDHILLENIKPGTKIQFKNVKTNEITTKEYGTFMFMPDIYKLFSFYKEVYKDEIMEDTNKTLLSNPSSSSFFM